MLGFIKYNTGNYCNLIAKFEQSEIYYNGMQPNVEALTVHINQLGIHLLVSAVI